MMSVYLPNESTSGGIPVFQDLNGVSGVKNEQSW